MNSRKMKNIGWVCEYVRKNIFSINTYDDLAEKAKITQLAVKEKHTIFQKNVNITFYVKKGSIGTDFERAVATLKAIRDIR